MVQQGFEIIKNEIPRPFRFSQGLRNRMQLPGISRTSADNLTSRNFYNILTVLLFYDWLIDRIKSVANTVYPSLLASFHP